MKEKVVEHHVEAYRWAADIFALRAGFMKYSTGVALRIHCADSKLVEKLRATFGGRTAAVAGTNRWLIHGEQLRVFVDTIEPLLQKDADAMAVIAMARKVLQAKPPRGAKRSSARGMGTAEAALATLAALEEGTINDEIPMEIAGRVPPKPWTKDEAILSIVEPGKLLTLKAENEEQAAAFVRFAQTQGLQAEANAVYVLLTKGKEEE